MYASFSCLSNIFSAPGSPQVSVQAVQRYLQLIHIPIMIDVILVFCLVSADFFHLRCWQYISQYFYPIEGIIRFSLRNIKE